MICACRAPWLGGKLVNLLRASFQNMIFEKTIQLLATRVSCDYQGLCRASPPQITYVKFRATRVFPPAVETSSNRFLNKEL